MKFKWIYFFWAAIFLIFFGKAVIFLDPDFGWHYQMGKLITENGIPKTDQFSYTMPSYLYIDHEWLTDIAIYKVYSLTGTFGLAFLWSLFGVMTLYLSTLISVGTKNISSKFQNQKTKISVLMLGTGLLISQFGTRPQVLSWFLFALELWIFGYWQTNKWVKFLFPVMFLTWANLHGMFVFGLVYFGLYIVIDVLRTRKIVIIDALFFIGAILVTFINPYGITMWYEVFSTFFNKTLHAQVEEWKPIWTGLNVCYPFVVSLIFALIVKFKNRFKPSYVILFIILLVMSLGALINQPLLTVSSIPLLIFGILLLGKNVTNIKYGKKRFHIGINIFLAISYFLFTFSVLYAFRGAVNHSEDSYYPKNAVTYIARNLPTGEVFAPYNWGGYLIWKLPQKKVFVDGRMAHWPSILDYQASIVLGIVDYKEAFTKYNIQMVLWPKSHPQFKDKIVNDGWRVIYSDNVSDVFTKDS